MSARVPGRSSGYYTPTRADRDSFHQRQAAALDAKSIRQAIDPNDPDLVAFNQKMKNSGYDDIINPYLNYRYQDSSGTHSVTLSDSKHIRIVSHWICRLKLRSLCQISLRRSSTMSITPRSGRCPHACSRHESRSPRYR